NDLSDSATPEYRKMHTILNKIIKVEQIDINLPCDWVGRSMPQAKNESQLQGELKRLKELVARKKVLELRMVELYALSGDPRTLEEVRAEMRRKDRKLRKMEGLLNQSDEDKEDGKRRQQDRTEKTREDGSDGDRPQSSYKKRKSELTEQLARSEEDNKDRRAAKEVTAEPATSEMVREQLETVLER
ncbi:hypothetical protein PMAYCL1PPCAC_21867, partial [Pristionchus mayeri]